VGARVNGKMVPLRYKMKNGDIVEIVTAAGHNPSRDWLTFTVTNKAKAKIRHYLNTAERQQAIEIGRKHLERELRRYDLSLKKILSAPAPIESLAQELGGGPRIEDLFAAIGYGKVSVKLVLTRLVPPEKLESPAPEKARPVVDAVKRLLRVGDERIKVRGTDDLLVYRARCCNPIMGEPIVGYITRGKGVSVHSQKCPNVTALVYDPERRIAVEWDREGDSAYEVRLAVGIEDRPGALAAVTAALAAQQTDIRDAQVRTFDDRTASIELTVRIHDLTHLERVVKSVRGVNGVLDVERHGVAR
jgi:guanosine-3',5'-bis(diphosphate) 3'-pyrophosphohydrolase